MVTAHISELFRRSKASVLMLCKWDKQIHSTASSLYNLVDIHGKAVTSIVSTAELLDARLLVAPIVKDPLVCLNGKTQNNCANDSCSETGTQFDDKVAAKTLITSDEISRLYVESKSEEGIMSCPFKASELANLLAVLAERQELCFSVVPLLWHKMIVSPETQLTAESSSAQQGWRQVVDVLCNVVSASPTIAATAFVLRADRELQPWIAKDEDLVHEMWRINQRIVKLIVDLMRNHDAPESLVILASALDLLLRATDGMLVDGEACTLPQLEET